MTDPKPADLEDVDAPLLAAATRGDRAALEQLVARYAPRILRFGAKMCRQPEDAEDVAQETLMAMARSIRDFHGQSSLSTWLYKIARSFCIKKRRRSKFAPTEQVSLDAKGQAPLADPAPAVDEQLEARRLGAALEAAIAALEPKYREVILLRDVEGLTALEVAQVTGLSIEAIKSRLHRARSMLRDRLAPVLQAPPAPPAGDCPDIAPMYSRYLEGEISADRCAEMERHLAGCTRCQAACEGLRGMLALCRTAPAVPVPAALQASLRAAIAELIEKQP
jgi:RNA polymerase sigma-70 factor (ECF subfamily)